MQIPAGKKQHVTLYTATKTSHPKLHLTLHLNVEYFSSSVGSSWPLSSTSHCTDLLQGSHDSLLYSGPVPGLAKLPQHNIFLDHKVTVLTSRLSVPNPDTWFSGVQRAHAEQLIILKDSCWQSVQLILWISGRWGLYDQDLAVSVSEWNPLCGTEL